MEVDNPCDSSTTTTNPTKHGAAVEVDSDENDNKTNAKRIKGSPEQESLSIEKDNSEDRSASAESNVDNVAATDKEKRSSQQRLDVPSKELQCIQKQVLIEKLMDVSTAGVGLEVNSTEPMDAESDEVIQKIKPTSKKNFKKPQLKEKKTFKIQSSLLAKVKSFLPEMKTANEELLKLPDPSKISLESDSDLDEMDGRGKGKQSTSAAPKPGTSASMKENDESGSKTFVEMNIALVDETDSDTSSDGEELIPSPIKLKSSSSPKKSNPVTNAERDRSKNSKDELKEGKEEKKTLITELN